MSNIPRSNAPIRNQAWEGVGVKVLLVLVCEKLMGETYPFILGQGRFDVSSIGPFRYIYCLGLYLVSYIGYKITEVLRSVLGTGDRIKGGIQRP
jgi:hypothetical protein